MKNEKRKKERKKSDNPECIYKHTIGEITCDPHRHRKKNGNIICKKEKFKKRLKISVLLFFYIYNTDCKNRY